MRTIHTCRGWYLSILLLLPVYTGHTTESETPDAEALLERSREIQRLRAEIEALRQGAGSGPRHAYLTASKQNHPHLHQYYTNVARKLERIGALQFPELARELPGPLQARVDITVIADGTLQGVRLVKPSGNQAIDDAIIHIVRLAAPYPPFPEALRQQAEIVHLLHDWTFAPAKQQIPAPVD